ncbi:MAG TPA: YjiH family protein [Bacillota bacterium]|nr:YjiH family protein [Bacillota bacterium]HPL54674.1 YjiH family protein [Bacillota bacterium]
MKMNDMSKGVNTIDVSKKKGLIRFIVYPLLAILIYFIPFTINGERTILLSHLSRLLERTFANFIPYIALVVVLYGSIEPFLSKRWNKSVSEIVFAVFKLVGFVIALMAVFNFGPKFLFEEDMIPFLWNLLVIPILLMVYIAAIYIPMFLNYGVLEFLSVLLQPLMRLIWKTPGASALDALVSYMDGYAPAVIITNDLYKRGIYSLKEAIIIATGFSTVSITFIVVIAETLDLMPHWNLFFWACFITTFAVTAITARIYPISKKPDSYYDKKAEDNVDKTGNIFVRAINSGINAAQNAEPFLIAFVKLLKEDMIAIGAAVLSSILSIGLLGLLVAKYTPIFDVVGYIFYPFMFLARVPEPLMAAKAVAMEISEMFLPSLYVISAPLITKFVVAVTSVSAVLFFSASIPCLISTDIKISMKDIIIIWIERTIFSVLIAAGFAHIFL